MDFIGPFPETELSIHDWLTISWPGIEHFDKKGFTIEVDQSRTEVKFTHILLIVDYFSRFVWAFPTCGDNQDKVIHCLSWLLPITGNPIGIYVDKGHHFSSGKTQLFLSEQSILWIPSPVSAKKAIGIAEKSNDLLQCILKKVRIRRTRWPLDV
jgi:transposase InsO family protein